MPSKQSYRIVETLPHHIAVVITPVSDSVALQCNSCIIFCKKQFQYLLKQTYKRLTNILKNVVKTFFVDNIKTKTEILIS